jgi:hypothetical protein
LVQALWKTVWRLLKKLKTELPYNSAVPLLGLYLTECKLGYSKGTYTLMFIAALFTRCPKNGIRKCGIYIQWNFIQPQRRMKFCHLQVNGWNWRTSS